MCIENTLQQIIRQRTGGGEIIANFLFDTVEGKTPAVKTCHQLEAAKHLIRIGYPSDHTATDDRHSRGDATPSLTSHSHESDTPSLTSHSRRDDNPSLTRHSRESGNPVAQDEESPLSSMSDNHQATSSRHSRESGNPAAQTAQTSPTMSDHTVRPEPVKEPTSSRHSREDANPSLTRHSREACPRPRSGSGNPVAQTEADNPTHPVTYLDILNFNLAQLIRSETADGHTIVEFLLHIMTGRDSAYTPNRLRIKPADRMAASREILRRGYGHFGRRRRLIDDAEETNDYDTLHTDLAKRLRQYSEEGSQVILFLLNVMKNEVPDEEYTTRHRMSAAQELLRRGWDTNYDKIKSEHLIDYWQDQQSARLSVGQKKQLAGLQTYADEYDAYDNKDYEPQAQALHAQQDRESEATSPRHSREACPRPRSGSGNPAAQNKETSRAPKPTPKPNQKNTYNYTKSDPDPEQDGYYEPLSPEDQALFDYHTKIESGDYEEDEIQPRPVTEADRLGYQAMLKWIQETAQAEGVPVLPNPLSGTLKHPKARSP